MPYLLLWLGCAWKRHTSEEERAGGQEGKRGGDEEKWRGGGGLHEVWWERKGNRQFICLSVVISAHALWSLFAVNTGGSTAWLLRGQGRQTEDSYKLLPKPLRWIPQYTIWCISSIRALSASAPRPAQGVCERNREEGVWGGNLHSSPSWRVCAACVQLCMCVRACEWKGPNSLVVYFLFPPKFGRHSGRETIRASGRYEW